MSPEQHLLTGVSLFVIFFLLINIFQWISKESAYNKPFIFGPIVFLFVFLPVYVIDILRELLWLPGILVLSFFGCISVYLAFLWQQHVDFTKSAEYEKYPFLLTITPVSSLIKVIEIVFQQLCAVLIIKGLFGLHISIWYVVTAFTVIVFLLHSPSKLFFGKFFGRYFLIVSTLMAFILPILFQIELRYVYIAISIHIAGYWLLYGIEYKKIQKNV